MKRTIQAALTALLLAGVSTASANIKLYTSDGSFAGCLDCGKYDSDSVCNKYGTYGSKYNPESIWNKYGVGSKYQSDSPFNKYGSGLKMVSLSGSYLGQFSMSYEGTNDARKLLKQVWELADGDYDDMRELLCD